MSGESQINTSGWRNYWIVKNVLAEAPIIGSFFSTKGCIQSLNDAGKCTAMFIGGWIGMMMAMPAAVDAETNSSGSNNESAELNKAKLTLYMAVGMWSGKAVYNAGSSACNMLYQYTAAKCKSCCTEKDKANVAPSASPDPSELDRLKSPEHGASAESSSLSPL
jgi:hypothetical protein